MLLLGGCDQFRSRVAVLIAPEAPAQTLQTIERLIGEGKYLEAKNQAQQVVDKPGGPLRGEFAFAAARASAMKGDTEDALRYLALAFQIKSLNVDEVLAERAFHGLKTNVQFLQIIAQNAPSTSKPVASSGTHEVGAGLTQIRQDSSGTEVRAGDVVIKLPY